MLISSVNNGDCFPVSLDDYKEFLDRDSFISCGSLAYYSFDFLRSLRLRKLGTIRADHLVALRDHLVDHDFMVQWEISVVCEALKRFVGG